MVEAHRARGAPPEPELVQRSGGVQLPLLRGIAGAVEAPAQPAAKAGPGALRRQLNAHVPHGRGEQVCFLSI
eukprot:9882378-Alexandrium_andersonii.AAC.1